MRPAGFEADNVGSLLRFKFHSNLPYPVAGYWQPHAASGSERQTAAHSVERINGSGWNAGRGRGRRMFVSMGFTGNV